MSKYQLKDLLFLMRRLRDPEAGCPWDLEQSPQTIINYSIEEVYELAEVIEAKTLNYDAFKDELGDVLLQVVFLAQFAFEDEQFEFADVVHHLCEKMVRRHPHVFPGGELYNRTDETKDVAVNRDLASEDLNMSADDVLQSWEAIKAAERGNDNSAARDLFANIPLQLPALSRALKFQKKARKLGLDWPDAMQATKKIQEEVNELILALDNQTSVEDHLQSEQSQTDEIGEELGDLLFSVVNVARKLDRDPEQLLRAATAKFSRRVNDVQRSLAQEGVDGDADPQLAEKFWSRAKAKGL